MPSEKLKSLLTELKAELKQTAEPDNEVLRLMQTLDTQLQAVLNTQEPSDASITDTLAALESHFAVNHPVAERYIRDLLDALNKMGI